MARAVLFNALGIVGGGQETRARELLARWRTYDEKTPLVVVKNADHLQALPEIADCRIIERPYRLGRLNALDRLAWEQFALPGLLRRLGIDAYLSFSHYLAGSFPTSVRSVIGVSNLAPFSRDARDAEKDLIASLRLRVLRRTIVTSARRADCVIALSATCARILAEHGVDPDRIVVLPNGIARLGVASESREVGRSFILYVSNFWRYKNFEVVVRAFAMLPEPLRDACRLLLVGHPYDKAYFDEISALVASHGVASRVELIAGLPQPELAHLYDNASVFVFASLVENSPNIVLEAMSRGAPLLLSKSEPMPEFGGDAARYFDPKSPEDLAASLQTLLGDARALARMRSASLARASLFSWDRFTQRVVGLVHQ